MPMSFWKLKVVFKTNRKSNVQCPLKQLKSYSKIVKPGFLGRFSGLQYIVGLQIYSKTSKEKIRRPEFVSEIGVSLGFFLIAKFIAKIEADLQKVRVFMPKVLLGEILGN